jgi:hypothetical protein
MNIRKFVLGIFVSALLIISANGASAATIDFSEHTDITGDANGDGGFFNNPDTLWTAEGIIISNAYWYDDGRDPFSTPCGLSAEGYGASDPSTITFVTPVNSVTFDWWTIVNSMNVDVYDSSHTLLDSTGTLGNPSLSVDSGTNTLVGSGIKYLEFHNSDGLVQISTLTFSSSNDIPEFPTIALPIISVLGLMFIFGRRKE